MVTQAQIEAAIEAFCLAHEYKIPIGATKGSILYKGITAALAAAAEVGEPKPCRCQQVGAKAKDIACGKQWLKPDEYCQKDKRLKYEHNATIERCAQVADDYFETHQSNPAAAIRALKEKP